MKSLALDLLSPSYGDGFTGSWAYKSKAQRRGPETQISEHMGDTSDHSGEKNSLKENVESDTRT